ncbi:MAG: hypothetical protein LBG05_09105 [Treponema sp.]|jgi:hypothetical protein|nr:hypothetical protein [Treponema sp.]
MKISIYIVLVVVWASPVFSDALEELVGVEQAEVLRRGNSITRVAQKASMPELLPKDPTVGTWTNEVIRVLDPSILTESLGLYKKESTAKVSWTEEERIALLNETLDLDSLAGLEYYSESRKTMRTFYEKSQVIDGPLSKNAREVPQYETLPTTITLYARQKDLTFGDNIYQYDYYVYGNAIIFIQQNLTGLAMGIIPAVGKNNLRSVAAVLDAEDCLLVYAASFAKTISIPGMKERIGKSFSSRANAMLGWFIKQADKAFK